MTVSVGSVQLSDIAPKLRPAWPCVFPWAAWGALVFRTRLPCCEDSRTTWRDSDMQGSGHSKVPKGESGSATRNGREQAFR